MTDDRLTLGLAPSPRLGRHELLGPVAAVYVPHYDGAVKTARGHFVPLRKVGAQDVGLVTSHLTSSSSSTSSSSAASFLIVGTGEDGGDSGQTDGRETDEDGCDSGRLGENSDSRQT